MGAEANSIETELMHMDRSTLACVTWHSCEVEICLRLTLWFYIFYWYCLRYNKTVTDIIGDYW